MVANQTIVIGYRADNRHSGMRRNDDSSTFIRHETQDGLPVTF